ncbi:hypothetical protein [Xanthomonas phage vB_XooS_NR08]|nr:hypothetical protein [Xanthomonas phage vB_XooS_NR08]
MNKFLLTIVRANNRVDTCVVVAEDQEYALEQFYQVEAKKSGSGAPEAVSVTVEDF